MLNRLFTPPLVGVLDPTKMTLTGGPHLSAADLVMERRRAGEGDGPWSCAGGQEMVTGRRWGFGPWEGKGKGGRGRKIGPAGLKRFG